MNNMFDNDGRVIVTMERELTRHDLHHGAEIPANWPMDEFPRCEEGKKATIVMKDRVIPDKLWRFEFRRYEPPAPNYKFLRAGDWKEFVQDRRRLIAGDKIVIEVAKTLDLNQRAGDGYDREYTITAMRFDPTLRFWFFIPPM